MKKIAIITGEASGDLYGASLAVELKKLMPDCQVWGMGGKLMLEAEVKLQYHIADSAVMGITELLGYLPALWRKLNHLKRRLKVEAPDAIVFVDFPDFNLRLLKRAYKLKIPAIYYIPPKAWAWRSGRAKLIAECASAVACIFPFEADFYKNASAKAYYVGHPILDVCKSELTKEEARRKLNFPQDITLIGLMPGSRKEEVKRLLPIMLKAADKIKAQVDSVRFIIPLAPTIPKDMINIANMDFMNSMIRIVENDVYDVMRAADLMIIASGTATLEAACMNVPMIIIYKLSSLTWQLVKRMVKIRWSGLPNIISQRQIVPEFLQDQATPEAISQAALKLLVYQNERLLQKSELEKVKARLGQPGAARRVAQLVFNTIHKNQALTVQDSLETDEEMRR